MRNHKKWIALLAAVMMLGTMLTGCGEKEEPENNDTPAVEDQQGEVEEPTEFSYPMDGREITLCTVMTGQATSAGYDNMGETEFAKNVEALTGIKTEYVVNNGDFSEWLNLKLAEDEYEDVIHNYWSNYPGGAEGAYNDGVIIELNDVIDQYMPNFKAYLAAHPEVDKAIKTDDGKYYQVPGVMSDPSMNGTQGIYVRWDWFEELGLEMPTTMDEWHDALTKIKEAKNVTPIVTGKEIFWNGTFLNAFCPDYDWAYGTMLDENGKVVHMYSSDAFKEYLTIMNQWYEEGLIDKDIATLDSDTVKSKIINDQAAVSFGYVGGTIQGILMEVQQTNPDYTFKAATTTTRDKDTDFAYTCKQNVVSTIGAAISTSCEDIEAAARYIDFFFSEEGIMASNFGIEGVSYEIVDGEPVYTDEIINNPDGLDMNAAMGKYIRSYAAFPGVQDARYLKARYVVEEAKEALETWGHAGTFTSAVQSGTLSYTSEESEILGSKNPDITTTTEEMMVKFLIGTADIETEWDSYVEKLDQLGRQELVEAVSAAYERSLQ